MLVSARLPAASRLSADEQRELRLIQREGERLRPTTSRGSQRAGWCVNFIGSALKAENDGGLVMPYFDGSWSEGDLHAYVQYYKKLRAFYERCVYPRFLKYFAAELSMTMLVFLRRDLPTFSKAINGSTTGTCYVNRQHIDEDLGPTMLACTGEPTGGGEFIHAEHGRAHRVRAGDLLFVNPAQRHGTGEFLLAGGDKLRSMTAFFLKTDVVRALGLSAADAAERGLVVRGARRKVTRRGPKSKRRSEVEK